MIPKRETFIEFFIYFSGAVAGIAAKAMEEGRIKDGLLLFTFSLVVYIAGQSLKRESE